MQRQSNPTVGLGPPLGNSSYETFEKTLNQTGNILNDAKDLSLMLVKAIYSGNNTFLNKVLKTYRENCVFRNEVRNLTLNAVNSVGLGYSLYKARQCASTLDKVALAAIIGYAGLNLTNVVRLYVREN